MIYLFRAFVAGMLVPAILAPFIIAFIILQGEVQAIASLPFVYFGAILWGLWNVLFVLTRNKVPIESRNKKIGAYGAAYGLLSALLNTLYFDFTSVLGSLSDGFIVVSIILYPLALYYVWKYVVNALNLILEVY